MSKNKVYEREYYCSHCKEETLCEVWVGDNEFREREVKSIKCKKCGYVW